MKNLVAIAASLAALVCLSDDIANKETDNTKLSRKDILHVRAGGGMIEKPGTQRGYLTIINAQADAQGEWLMQMADYLRGETKLNISVKDGEFDLYAPKVDGQMSIFVADDKRLPTLLIAPENRWAMVNVSSLKTEKTVFFEARVKKELSRAFALLCSGAATSFNLSLVGPVSSVNDLDKFANYQLPYDVLNRVPLYLKPYGLIPSAMTTYRNACKEGWAPAPTNIVQQTIWDEVNTIPSEPIKIQFEKK